MNGPHQREQAVERMLRQSFAAREPASTDACLDAEMLAAWMDDGLSGVLLETAQAHVADCARCQALVGAMVRTAEVPALASPETPAARPWWLWLAPFAAAAAAVVLWVALPDQSPDSAASVPESLSAAKEATAQDRLGEPLVSGAPPAAPVSQPSRETAVASQPSPAIAEPQSAPVAAAPVEASRARQANQARADLADGRAAEKAESRDARGGAVAEPPPAAALRAPAAGAADPAAARADGQAAVPAPAAPAFGRLQQGSRGASTGPLVVVSPDPQFRWRLRESVVDRSADGGRTWSPVWTTPGPALTAGSAPSPAVCWIVGSGGLVLRSVDGVTFSRVAFPEMTDLSAVQAADARAATVVALDGRRFQTADGGLTWSQR